jgi:Fe-S cluster assembly scaffold protein SufB
MNSLKYLTRKGIKKDEAVRLIIIAQAKVARVQKINPRVR